MSALISFVPVSFLHAFELLSEGAMDSVSAVSAETAEDIINIAGAPAAGLTVDGYESLPFQTRIRVESSDTDEVSDDLDYALVREVEGWADDLRERVGSGFEIGYIEELPQSDFDSGLGFDGFVEERDYSSSGPASYDSDETRYEVSRIEQTFELLDVGADTISFRFERYIERAATVNADPFADGGSVGSGYITELRSSGSQTLTAIRNEDKPLF